MSRTNGESQTGPQFELRAQRNLKILIASFQERLEAMKTVNGRGNASDEGENPSSTWGELTNLLLLKLLQKQNE